MNQEHFYNPEYYATNHTAEERIQLMAEDPSLVGYAITFTSAPYDVEKTARPINNRRLFEERINGVALYAWEILRIASMSLLHEEQHWPKERGDRRDLHCMKSKLFVVAHGGAGELIESMLQHLAKSQFQRSDDPAVREAEWGLTDDWRNVTVIVDELTRMQCLDWA